MAKHMLFSLRKGKDQPQFKQCGSVCKYFDLVILNFPLRRLTQSTEGKIQYYPEIMCKQVVREFHTIVTSSTSMKY